MRLAGLGTDETSPADSEKNSRYYDKCKQLLKQDEERSETDRGVIGAWLSVRDEESETSAGEKCEIDEPTQ